MPMTITRLETVAGDPNPRRRFVRDVASRASLPAHVTVETAAITVLSNVVGRFTRGAAFTLLHALPGPVADLFERCVEQQKGPVSSLDRSELLAATARDLGVAPLHAEAICRAVLSAVRAQLPPEIADHLAVQLPADLRELWAAHPSRLPTTTVVPDDANEALRLGVLAEIDKEAAELPPGVDAAAAFLAVMCLFSKRLSGGEARHLYLALPSTLRPLLTGCMIHRDERPDAFDRAQLIRRVARHFAVTESSAERISRAVLRATKRCLPPKEVGDAASQLPPDLRELWLTA